MLKDTLFQIMQAEKINASDLARKLMVTPSMMSRILTEDKKPGRKFLKGLAISYPKVVLDYLIKEA